MTQVVVSRRALEGTDRPGFVYRQAPMSATDSGWAVMVGDESSEELDDPRAAVSLDRQLVVARWPELAPVLASDVSEDEWVWDADRAAYVPLVR